MLNTEQLMAKLAINKSLLKEYDVNNYRTVYMKNGDEFQIQLYNPTSSEIAVKVSINNEVLSNLLVLRPAERIWLERYLDKAKKFKFSTYMVEDNVETEKAIENNGNIKLEFFNKKTHTYISTYTYEKPHTYWTTYYSDECLNTPLKTTTLDCANNISYNYDTVSSLASSLTNIDLSYGSLKGTVDTSYVTNNQIETGRIDEGSYSDQKFDTVNTEFESWPFKTETIKILPESRKPYTANDLEKIYCTECGRKLKPKYKFCPYCGTKIE